MNKQIPLLLALLLPFLLLLPQVTSAQGQPTERKQEIYDMIVGWYEKLNSTVPVAEELIPLAKQILEKEEFSGHVLSTAEIENMTFKDMLIRSAPQIFTKENVEKLNYSNLTSGLPIP